MDSGLHGKHKPHMFRAEEIVTKMRNRNMMLKGQPSGLHKSVDFATIPRETYLPPVASNPSNAASVLEQNSQAAASTQHDEEMHLKSTGGLSRNTLPKMASTSLNQHSFNNTLRPVKIKKKAQLGNRKKSRKSRQASTDEPPPESTFLTQNPAFMRMMQEEFEPIPIAGPKAAGPNAVPADRKVIWKRVCKITDVSSVINVEERDSMGRLIEPQYDRRECIIEMSRSKTKFWIVAVDLETGKYSVVEMFRVQAEKILRAVDNSLSTLMRYLEFRFGTLCIKDQELLLSYQLYMSPQGVRNNILK